MMNGIRKRKNRERDKHSSRFLGRPRRTDFLISNCYGLFSKDFLLLREGIRSETGFAHPFRLHYFQATGSHDHIVYLYDFDQKPIKPMMLRGHFGNVRALAFSHLPILVCTSSIWKI